LSPDNITLNKWNKINNVHKNVLYKLSLFTVGELSIGEGKKTFLNASRACTLAQPSFYGDYDQIKVNVIESFPTLEPKQEYWVGYRPAHAAFFYDGEYCNIFYIKKLMFYLNRVSSILQFVMLYTYGLFNK